MSSSLQVMLLTAAFAGSLGAIVFLGAKAVIYVVKGVFKNEKIG